MDKKALMNETALPEHPTLRHPHTGEPLQALGFYRGRPLWPMLGAAEDDGGDGSSDDGDAGAEDEDADDTGADEGKGKDKAPAGETVTLAKFRKLERHLSAADKRRTEAEKELQQLRDKDLPAVEKSERDRAEAVARAEKAESQYTDLARRHAFLLESQRQKIQWKNPTAALKLADLDELEVGEKGTVDGITEAIEALAKEHAYLVEVPKTEDEDDDKDSKASKPKSGSPVGGRQKQKTPPGHKTDEELRNMFPALRK